MTGAVGRSYGATVGPAPTVVVRIYLQPTSGPAVLLVSATTSAAGTYTATAAPLENGSLYASVAAVAGYQNSTSAAIPLAVTSKITATAPAKVAAGRAATISVALRVGRVAPVTVQEQVGSAWVTRGTATTSAAGTVNLTISGLASGKHTLRAGFGGDVRGAAATSTPVTLTVG